MFDLEQSIANWCRQMLAAGIKSPVPLEELEVHLREEIERQERAGLGGQQAFESAIQKIGNATALKKEFRNVEPWRQKLARLKSVWLALALGAIMEAICMAALYWMNQHDRYHSFYTDFGDPTTIWSRGLFWFHLPGIWLSEFFFGSPWAPPYPGIDMRLVFGAGTLQWSSIFYLIGRLLRRRKTSKTRYA